MQTETVGSFSLDDNVWQGVILTDAAAKQVKTLMTQDPEVKGLQLSVKQSGCAGFGYVLDLTKQPASDDLVFEHDGALLFVPLKAMPFIDGTEVDFTCFAAASVRITPCQTLSSKENEPTVSVCICLTS